MLKNKVAIITGASRGIGKAIAIDFARKGCNVIINFFNNENTAETLVDYIKDSFNVEAIAIRGDVSSEKDMNYLLDLTFKHFSKIDILVNNAAIIIDKPFAERKVSDFECVIKTNLIGPFILCQKLAPIMYKNKYGKIINIASTNGIDTFEPFSLDYDASKSGIISLTKNTAVEFAPYVNVNAVAPGWINTDMNLNLPKDLIECEKRKIYLKRFGDPAEVAKVVSFLSSDDSSYITGEVIRVDGGL